MTPASVFIGSYKFTLNPFSGCGSGREYCYARFFALSARPRDEWGQWISAKQNARRLVAKACRTGAIETGDAVYMSSVTDPYQPIERRLRLTRSILETFLEFEVQPRLTIQTRSSIVTRDIDLLRQFETLRVNFTIETDSEAVRTRYSPHTPAIAARFRAATEVAGAGIRIGCSISPMLPIGDIEAFGDRLARLDADEYVTQYLHHGTTRFAAGTSIEAMSRVRAGCWGIAEYQRARELLASRLGAGHTLLEGAEGYAPV